MKLSQTPVIDPNVQQTSQKEVVVGLRAEQNLSTRFNFAFKGPEGKNTTSSKTTGPKMTSLKSSLKQGLGKGKHVTIAI